MPGETPVLAVLPFAVTGGEGDDLPARGLVDDISGELTRFRRLAVVSPVSGAAVADLPDRDAGEADLFSIGDQVVGRIAASLAARLEDTGLVETLAKALGLGGRRRRFGDAAERARSAVTWRIRHAVKRIERAHAPLARHLANPPRQQRPHRHLLQLPARAARALAADGRRARGARRRRRGGVVR